MVSLTNNNTRNVNNDYYVFYIKTIIDSKRIDLLEECVNDGLDLNLKDEYGESILEYALSSYNLPMAFYLVKCGADPQPIIDNSLSNMIIISDGDLDILKIAVAHGLDINRQDELGNTLLSIAIHEGKLDMIKYLIDNNANLNLTSWEGSYSQINEMCHHKNDLYYKIKILIDGDRENSLR